MPARSASADRAGYFGFNASSDWNAGVSMVSHSASEFELGSRSPIEPYRYPNTGEAQGLLCRHLSSRSLLSYFYLIIFVPGTCCRSPQLNVRYRRRPETFASLKSTSTGFYAFA
jgi:hypothetical protein